MWSKTPWLCDKQTYWIADRLDCRGSSILIDLMCILYTIKFWTLPFLIMNILKFHMKYCMLIIRFAGYPAGYPVFGYPAFWYPVSGRIPDTRKMAGFAGYRILNRISGTSLKLTFTCPEIFQPQILTDCSKFLQYLEQIFVCL